MAHTYIVMTGFQNGAILAVISIENKIFDTLKQKYKADSNYSNVNVLQAVTLKLF